MDYEKFTIKAQEAINEASGIAQKNDHPQIDTGTCSWPCSASRTGWPCLSSNRSARGRTGCWRKPRRGPVWAGAPAPALQSFIAETKPVGKRIALFLCHAGGSNKALDKLASLLPLNTIAGSIDFVNPGKQDRTAVAERVRAWADGLRA